MADETLTAEPVEADTTQEAAPEGESAPETPPEETPPEGEDSPSSTPAAPESTSPEQAGDLAEPPETLRVTWEDGTESDVPVTELVHGYQLAIRARDDIKAAEGISAAAQEILRGVVENPFGTIHDALTGIMGGDREKALEELGRQVSEFADAWKAMKGLPPAEQELMRLRREHASLKANLDRERSKSKNDAETQAVAAAEAKAKAGIDEALKVAGLPAKPAMVKAVARQLLDAHQAKEKLSYAQAVERVKKQLQTELEERLKALGEDPKAFEGLYPKVTELVRKRDLNGVKTALSARVQPREGAERTPAKPQKPRVLRNDNWNELFGG